VTRRLGDARLGLLASAAGYRRLFLASLTSVIGTWLAFVALVIDVSDRTADARWVSALLVVEFLPIVAVGLFVAPLIDRVSRRGILVASDLFRAAVFCVLPFAGSALAIVLLALAAGVATSLFRPAVYAGLPNLVADRDLPSANGLLQTAENATWAVGAFVGGALVAVSGPDAAYWFNAATFVASALLIVRIRENLEEERAASEGHWRDLAAGLSFVVRSRPLLTVLVAWSIVMFATAGVNVAEVFLAKDVFGAGDFGYGFLVATAAVGLVAGSLAGGPLIDRWGMRGPYALSIGLMAAGFAAAAAAPNVWLAGAFAVGAGLGNGAAVVCNAVLVQRSAPDRLRGRAFTVVMSTGYAVLGVGMLVAGPATNEYGARAAWAAAAALCAAGAVTGYVLLRGADI
jgi:MFS family permease